MKKTINYKGVITLSLAAAMLTGTCAFAETASTAEESVMLISEEMEEEISVAYGTKTGTVESIETNEEGASIMLEDGDMGLVLNLRNSTYIMDAEDGSLKSAADIEEGMELVVVINDRTPMTMSIPPMISTPDAVVIKGENSKVDVLKFDNSLVSEDGSLMLNIGEDTMISDIKGSRKMFTEADIKGSTAIVVYSMSTRSIPAQTTPETVVIVGEGKTEMVGLRAAAEKAGYEVEWTANDEAVVISKDGIEIKALCGSAIVEKTNFDGVVTSTVLKEAIHLVDSTMMVSSDIEALFE